MPETKRKVYIVAYRGDHDRSYTDLIQYTDLEEAQHYITLHHAFMKKVYAYEVERNPKIDKIVWDHRIKELDGRLRGPIFIEMYKDSFSAPDYEQITDVKYCGTYHVTYYLTTYYTDTDYSIGGSDDYEIHEVEVTEKEPEEEKE